jgi:hypothetical protein
MAKNYILILNFGYVESQTLGYVPFASNKKFATAQAALISLAEFFKRHFLGEEQKPEQCCLDMLSANPKAKFCSNCSTSLLSKTIDQNLFYNYILDIARHNSDSYSAECVSYFSDDQEWEPIDIQSCFKKGANVRFVSQAEVVIPTVLGFTNINSYKARTKEEIFERFSKEKNKTFSPD